MYFPDDCFDKVLKCGPIVIVLSLFYARYKSTQTKCLIKMHTGFTKHFHLQKLQSIRASLMRQHRSWYKLWCNICAPTIALWPELTNFVPISTCIFLFQETDALIGIQQGLEIPVLEMCRPRRQAILHQVQTISRYVEKTLN